jgi:hypothetical protein
MSTSTHTSTGQTTGGQDKLATLCMSRSVTVSPRWWTPRGGGRCWTPPRSSTTTDLGNLLLIALAPQAARVAGFRSWQSLGRPVRKGERGLAILAPCTYRPTTSSSTTDNTSEAPRTSV